MPAQPKRPPYFSQEHGSWVIPLTKSVIALVDEDIAELLGRHAWQAHASRTIWYAARGIHATPKNCWIQMHREIMGAADGEEVDHRQHYPHEMRLVDNRRANLRVCKRIQNMCNQRKRRGTYSKYKGLSRNPYGWVAAIRRQGVFRYLGFYANEIEAALAYDQAARELFGEFAATNESLGLLPPEFRRR